MRYLRSLSATLEWLKEELTAGSSFRNSSNTMPFFLPLPW